MEKRVNRGYEIINSMQLQNPFGTKMEVVMGQNVKAPDSFVTWAYYPQNDSYEHGHYFASKDAALRDFFERGLDEMELDLRGEYQKENAIADMKAALEYEFKEAAIEGLLNNEVFLRKAMHCYDNIDHSSENDALSEELELLYDEMEENHEIFSFVLMEILEDAQKNSPNAVSVELKDGRNLTGAVYFNPKDSLTRFSLEMEAESVKTNIGEMPVEDYLDIRAQQYGFSSFDALKAEGYDFDVPKKYEMVEIQDVVKICLDGKEMYPRNDLYDLRFMDDGLSDEEYCDFSLDGKIANAKEKVVCEETVPKGPQKEHERE